MAASKMSGNGTTRPVTPTADMPTIELDANDLRAFVETFDGTREVEWYIAEETVGAKRRHTAVKKQDLKKGQTPVLLVRARNKPRVRPRLHELRVSTDPVVKLRDTDRTLAECDAIFTTLSALDKFVVPYYARLRPLADVEEMRREFANDPSILAAIHLPDSVEDSLVATGGVLALVADKAWTDAEPRIASLRPFGPPVEPASGGGKDQRARRRTAASTVSRAR
jgi:hypothetical protein